MYIHTKHSFIGNCNPNRKTVPSLYTHCGYCDHSISISIPDQQMNIKIVKSIPAFEDMQLWLSQYLRWKICNYRQGNTCTGKYAVTVKAIPSLEHNQTHKDEYVECDITSF